MSYQWTAHLKDQTYISKFKGEIEISFKEVLDAEKQSNLAMLHVSGPKNNYAVDLETGLFYIDNIAIRLFPEIKDGKYRVVYYARKRKETGANPRDTYLYVVLLGWQLTIDGKNHQRIIYIYPQENDNALIEFKNKR